MLAVILFVVAGVIGLRGLAFSTMLSYSTRHANDVVLNLVDLQLALDRLESTSREFALTGNEFVLDSDRATSARVQRDLLAIHAWTEEGSRLWMRLPPLEALIAQEIRATTMVAQVRRGGGLEATAELFRVGVGRKITDMRRALIRELRADGTRFLALEDEVATRQLQQTDIVWAIETLLTLAIGLYSWAVHRRNWRRRELAVRLQPHRPGPLALRVPRPLPGSGTVMVHGSANDGSSDGAGRPASMARQASVRYSRT